MPHGTSFTHGSFLDLFQLLANRPGQNRPKDATPEPSATENILLTSVKILLDVCIFDLCRVRIDR
jgi:hypothetical protein